MKWRDFRSRQVALTVFMVIGAVCAGIILWIANREPSEIVFEPEVVIPPEKRHDHLDVTVVKGLRYRYPGRGWDVRIGSVEIRRRAFGFIRIGALNEAVISEMHIALTPEHSTPDVIALFRALGTPHDGGDAESVRPKHRAPDFGLFLKELGVRSPHANMRVSHVRVRNMSLSYAPGPTKPDQILFQATSADIRGGLLRFSGLVEFGNLAGQRFTCREARLSLTKPPMVSVREAALYSGGVTQAVDRLSFPLSALLNDEDLLSYAD